MARPPIQAAEARRARRGAEIQARADISRMTGALRVIEHDAANATPETYAEVLQQIQQRAREQ